MPKPGLAREQGVKLREKMDRHSGKSTPLSKSQKHEAQINSSRLAGGKGARRKGVQGTGVPDGLEIQQRHIPRD